jgi:tetratricopeptide (TPR) repeat protein
MKSIWRGVAAVAVVLGSATALPAQTITEMLQKGIYLQDTMGDVDGAIKVYQQILQTARNSRAVAAQAQYRLAVCLQKKGNEGAAAQAWQRLIQDYPEQTELVAKARQAIGGTRLLSAPWAEGELLEMELRLASGKSEGIQRTTVRSSETTPDHWLIEKRVVAPGIQYFTRVEVDKATMKPLAASWNHPLYGEIQIAYREGTAQIDTKGKPSRTIALEGPVWDNEEAWVLLRRLPLAMGYKTTLALLLPTGSVLKVPASVTAVEDVQTAAGSFHCYKVELGILNQSLWFSADQSRYWVKLAVTNDMEIGELQPLEQAAASAPSTFRDEKAGFSVTVPGGWLIRKFDVDSSKDRLVVHLVDPSSQAAVALAVGALDLPGPATAEAMRTFAEKKISNHEDEKIRADSWQPRQINGHPALSWISDSKNVINGQPVVNYMTIVASEGLQAVFIANSEAQEFDAFRARFDPVVETLTLK